MDKSRFRKNCKKFKVKKALIILFTFYCVLFMFRFYAVCSTLFLNFSTLIKLFPTLLCWTFYLLVFLANWVGTTKNKKRKLNDDRKPLKRELIYAFFFLSVFHKHFFFLIFRYCFLSFTLHQNLTKRVFVRSIIIII